MNKKLLFGLVVLLLAALACSFASIAPERFVGSGKVGSETRSVSEIQLGDAAGLGQCGRHFWDG